MKRTLFLLLAVLPAASALETPRKRLPATPTPAATATPGPTAPIAPVALPEDTRAFTNNPEGAGLSINDVGEEIRSYATYVIVFPSAMVSADKIDAIAPDSPIAIWPELDAEFVWRTPTQGDLMIKGPILPAQAYRFRLRQDLKDAAGKALPQDEWGAEISSPGLTLLEEGYGERDELNARPQVPLEFNYPIRLADAAQHVVFQDRSTRERFPVEILVNRPDGEIDTEEVVEAQAATPDITSFRVRPLAPLPVGRRYDLVVDGICDNYGGRSLAYPRVFPLGTTVPNAVSFVAARDLPLTDPHIEIKFRQGLDSAPLPADAVTITPAVPNLRLRKEGQYITAEGDFDTKVQYTVTVSDQILAAGGYGLAIPETWGATFRPKTAAILFPDQQIRERSALGLRFAFYHVNTSDLAWRLAPVPLDKLPEVLRRVQDFHGEVTDAQGNPVWGKDGLYQRLPSEPLIPALGLTAVGSGTVPAADNTEALREIAWKPAEGALGAGPMLLEVTGKNTAGQVIGNRALIYFGESALTRKLTRTQTIIRVAGMGDGQPEAGARVVVLDKALQELAVATTDAEGLATFENTAIPTAAYFLAGETLQPISLSDAFSSGSLSSRPLPPLNGYTFTDRPLYRPGQAVQFKGMVRRETDGSIPAQAAVKWMIQRAYGSNDVLASGETKLDTAGGWHGVWTPPEGVALGDYVVRATVDNLAAGNSARFQIEEFRNPLFSVVCEETEPEKPAESVIEVASQYFHGAPNAGARVQWTATWESDSQDGYYSGDDRMARVDLYSEHRKQPTYTAEVSGETALDGNGQVVLRCAPPFADAGNRAHARVVWKVDITGPDGQTLTGGAFLRVAMEPVLLGIEAGEAKNGQITFEWDAKETFGQAPEAVNVRLVLVQTKSVKERLAPNVYRYRNFDVYQQVEERKGVKDPTITFTPKQPGRYVAVVAPLEGAAGFPVSEEVYLEGDEPSEVPVQSESSATVFSVSTPGHTEPWQVGETAVLNVLSPSGGIAWVSVETDTILDTFTVPLTGNTSRIEVPIKPEYEPNVTVSVYLLRPGGDNQLAGEMFGYASLSVRAPDRVLALAVTTSQAEYEPRAKITGKVTATADGQPVAGADLAIYAVDDAILTLGGWNMPQALASFFPSRPYAVVTYNALRGYLEKIAPSSLTMKGFVVGDGGAEEYGNVQFARKEFKPIILWQPSVTTNAQGEAEFACEAPDNLTRFRVIAVGQTKANQFGAGDTTFAVSKNLIIEPALPRFVREGDEVELRAVGRQKAAPDDTLTVQCAVGGALELIGEASQDVSATQDAPAVARFRARATSTGPAIVTFTASSQTNAALTDRVEVSLPVAEPVILQKESVSGTVGNTSFAVREVAPGAWENGRGTFQFAVSTTPWMAQLMGIPFLLEYPHGCFEQKSSRLLAYTYLANLLEYLPDAGARKANYQGVIGATLKEFQNSLLADGRLPYWPGGVEPNDFVTIQAAWCVGQAEAAGFAVPERLSSEVFTAMEAMATGTTQVSPTLRAFALFVRMTFEIEDKAELVAAANELYLQRDKLTGEGRALLAIALNELEIEPEKQKQLVRELPETFADIAFQPATFASATRTDALCTLARMLIAPDQNTKALEERLAKMLAGSSALSTQENLWLLVAFDSVLDAKKPARLSGLEPKPDAVAANSSAAAWTKRDIAQLADFVARGVKPGGSYVLQAAYRTNERETPLVSQGLRLERVVKNLTDAARTGELGAPFQLGDQVLISYRFSSDQPQAYVALEDLLPAGLEVVNPNLALFGKFYALPDGALTGAALLSHSEMRDQQTNLYFDQLAAGSSSYSVLARATAAGTFIWPATQMTPMYDSRFFGRSPSSVCTVVAE